VRTQLGYLPAPFGLPPHLHLEEYLLARAASQGVPRDRWPGLADALLTLVGLGGRQRVWTHELPPGQRQLLGIAGTLVHDPTVVLLEEPTAGLDSADRTRVWHLLHRLLDVSRTVIVISENLAELAAGCQDLVVIDRGRVVAQGPPAEVVAELGGARRIRVRLTNGAIRTHTVTDLAGQAALLRKLVEAGLEIAEFTEVPPGLHDLAHLGADRGPR
jgi:ABC-type multidrug transport system ATPase subunit